jgi:hypothetical protein
MEKSMYDSTGLTLRSVPSENASIDSINRFAHTIDGYQVAGSFEACERIARNPNRDSIQELHVAIFYIFRALRHTGEKISEHEEEQLRGFVGRIRELIKLQKK